MSTTNKTAQELGIEAFNKQAQDVAEGKAIKIVDVIVRLVACNAASVKNIEGYQKTLSDLQNPEINENSVLGATLPKPDSQNENQKTIASVIQKLAKGRQGGVEQAAVRLTEAVVAEQARIEANNNELASLRKELAEIKVATVSVSEVAGK